jgi:hypothetical protein
MTWPRWMASCQSAVNLQQTVGRAPRFRARTRRGMACQAPAMANRRCRLHGGCKYGTANRRWAGAFAACALEAWALLCPDAIGAKTSTRANPAKSRPIKASADWLTGMELPRCRGFIQWFCPRYGGFAKWCPRSAEMWRKTGRSWANSTSATSLKYGARKRGQHRRMPPLERWGPVQGRHIYIRRLADPAKRVANRIPCSVVRGDVLAEGLEGIGVHSACPASGEVP